MRVFITGVSGFTGSHLLQSVPNGITAGGSYKSNPVDDAIPDCMATDITDAKDIGRAIGDFRPDAVVHTAAISEVGVCEKDPDRAHRINVTGTKNIVDICREKSLRLVHVSTDMIYDGSNPGFYAEDDPPCPFTVYGRTKLEAEQYVTSNLPDATAIRPALIYGPFHSPRRGVLGWMSGEFESKGHVSLFSDQFRTPIYVRDICALVWKLLQSGESGVFHAGGPERMSREEMGRRYFARMDKPETAVHASTIEEVNVGYPVQRSLCLSSEKANSLLGITFRDFNAGLADSLASPSN